MYKFTNGVVVFDEKTRDAYIKAGLKLVEEPKKEEKKIVHEDKVDDGIIRKESKERYKISKRI